MVSPSDYNGSLKVGKLNPGRCAHMKMPQKMAKDQMAWLHLQLSCSYFAM